MKNRCVFVVTALLAAALIIPGCGGKSGEQSSIDKLQEQAKQMQKAAESMSNSAASDQKPVPPVSFKVLMGFLPKSVGGLTAGEPEGESATMGEWNFSQAKVSFHKDEGGQSVDVEIFDYAHIGVLYAPYQMLLNMKYSRESSKGYERSIRIGDFPAFEKWEVEGKENAVTVLVGDRFIVTCRCRDMAEGTAKSVVQGINLKSLSEQKAS